LGVYTRTNQFLLFARNYNTPLLGYGKTNDDELDKEKGWDMNAELRREGDISTKRIMAMM